MLVQYFKSAVKTLIGSLPGCYVDYHDCLIDNNTGIAFIALSKCASSSIKNSILSAYGSGVFEGISVHNVDVKKVNENLESCRILCTKRLSRKLSGYTVFTVCRSPYDRLLSCYIDHIKKKNPLFYRNSILRNYYGLHDNLSLSQFIDIVCKIPDSLSDRHFRSQSSSILDGSGEFIPSLVVKLEEINEAWESCDMLRHYSRPNKINANNYDDYTSSYYTEDIKNKVAARYKEDFNKLNYQE
jgi:hypothetical protein